MSKVSQVAVNTADFIALEQEINALDTPQPSQDKKTTEKPVALKMVRVNPTQIQTEASYGLNKILKKDIDIKDTKTIPNKTLAELAELEALDKPKEKDKPKQAKSKKSASTTKKPPKKAVAKKAEKKGTGKTKEENSLLLDLLAEAKERENRLKVEKPLNKFDARADEAVKSVGDGIISPFKALGGIKDIVTGEFDAGQKAIRNAVVDFANTPAKAANFVTAGVEAAVNDFAGETAGKIVSAPAKVLSGVWDTGTALVKPEENSVKNAFNKMISGLFG